ncbi:hypothetical protein ACWKT7_17985 [Bacillus toyonensis]|uniref:hypothetical protein n=1 Tax=Bacillus cereus group TaxID=86661 RepID=UPI00088B9D0F|nr:MULTISPECIES: hypothetical protein [Bacillus cereus group]PEC60924.1 hypothetical protein CON62_31310 [Bacillus toyonensis]PEM53628.1 hypothetical protein CN625_30755 [Bacillus toyonensis]PEN72214.1 hypothetical protein CN539_20850 [Bacillus toyonensis]PEN79687.1 hypothetical protein CN544_21480 [Bacillus toyonensis]PHD33157.1 hypothetical protein COF48_19015 [Bacillus toyonensis]
MERHSEYNKEEISKNNDSEPLKFEFEKAAEQPKTREQYIAEIIEVDKRVREAGRNMAKTIHTVNKGVNERLEIFSKTLNALIPKVNQSLLTISQTIIKTLNDIDWEAVNYDLEENAKETDAILQRFEKDFWCLDMEMYCDLEDGHISVDQISGYVEDRIELYIEEIGKDPIYELHSTLIKETYEAYKAGLYKMCAFPLLATFEYIISSWYSGNIKADRVSMTKTKKVERLYDQIKPEKFRDVDEDLMFKTFALSVLRMFKKLFKTRKKGFNRHLIMHGFHDYDSLTKTDILKLFQLLKSAIILRFFDLDKLKVVAES